MVYVISKDGKPLMEFTYNEHTKKMRKLFLMSAEQGYHLAINWREDDSVFHSIVSNYISDFLRELSNLPQEEINEFFQDNSPFICV